MNKTKEKKIIRASSDSKIYNVKEEICKQVEKNTSDITDLKSDVTFCIKQICGDDSSAISGSSELETNSLLSISEPNIEIPNFESNDDKLYNPLLNELSNEKELNDRWLQLRNGSSLDIYSDSYYNGLNSITEEIYQFWLKHYEYKDFSTDQYTLWEEFVKNDFLLRLEWSGDDFKKIINWLFIKYKNELIINDILKDLIQKNKSKHYLTSKNMIEFDRWWREKIFLKEKKFAKNEELNFNDKDFILNKKKIVWFIICRNDLTIKKYFRLKKIQFADEKIENQKILEIENIWDDILSKSFSDYIYDIFILNQKNNNQEADIKSFLDSSFKKVKIITNDKENSVFFDDILLKLNNTEFINSLFKQQNLEDIRNEFISFVNSKILNFDNFILKNCDQVNIFNNWLWKKIVTQFITSYSHNIVQELKNILSDFEINNFIKEIEIIIEKNNIDHILSEDSNKNLEKIMNCITDEVQILVQKKIKLNSILEYDDIKNDKKEVNSFEERLQQVLYKIGRENKDYANDAIVKYYIKYSNLKEKGIKSYYELNKKGKNILIKYARSLPIASRYLQTILKDCPDFTAKCDSFSNDVILYFSDRQSLKERFNSKNNDLVNHISRFNEINEFLIKFKINEDASKTTTETTHGNTTGSSFSRNNSTSISYMKIPQNDKIRELVEKYFLEDEIVKLNKQALKETMLVWVQNLTNYWNEVKVWIERYYLPPQIYFNWINNFIYLPIEHIYYNLQTNFTDYRNDDINKVLESISFLTENISNVIYNQFINKKNKYLDQIKYCMNIELSLDSSSISSICSNANNLTFLYDHLLRHIYLTIKESKTNKKIITALNFKGLHRRNSINMSCFGAPCTSTSITPESIVKHLEYLNLDFKGSINSTRTNHGCKKVRITNKYICENVNNILLEKKQLFKLLKFQDKINKKK